MLAHRGDVSEGTKSKVLKRCKILGKDVVFYTDGRHVVDGVKLTEQEAHDSELLRFAHASILINGPVGDMAACYVDMSRSPPSIWLYDKPASVFIRDAKAAILAGKVSRDQLEDEPVSILRGLRNE